MTTRLSSIITFRPRSLRAAGLTLLAAASLAACSDAPDGPGSAAQPPGQAGAAYTLSTDALGGYAPARTVRGELVAFSQVMAPAGEEGVVVGDVESQTGAALRLLDEALGAAGLSRGDVAHLTVHVVVDERGRIDAQGVARAWRRNFANAMQPAAPARTLVGVSALPAPGARISLTALAERPAPEPSESDDAR